MNTIVILTGLTGLIVLCIVIIYSLFIITDNKKSITKNQEENNKLLKKIDELLKDEKE